ncbi:MAG: hypothetical protein EA348_09540 [Pseudomonadaceae bacterium]|nr:MAG: hypothetical protein EA348_09540 [Pseudomonadaceae bacterium]
MAVGLNLLALLNPDTRSGAVPGLFADSAGAPEDQGTGSFAELLKGEYGDDLKAMLDDLPSAEREELLAAMAQLSLATDGKELPSAVDRLLQDLPDMPSLTDEAALRLQQGGEAALDVLATLVPEWRQWLSDAADDVDSERLQAAVDQVADSVAQAAESADEVSAYAALASGQVAANSMLAGSAEAEAESVSRTRFSLAQMLGSQRTQADDPANARDNQSRLDTETDKRSLNNDDFAGLRRKASLDLNANATTSPRAAETALRAEPATRRSGGEDAAEGVRVNQPGSAAAAAALTARPVAAASQALGVPFGQPGWSEAVVDKVMWMSSRNLSSVEIRLTPAEMGPLEITLQNRGQELQVQFVSQNPSVREALESQVVRLREMVGQQGLELVDVSVGDNGASQQQEQAERQAARLAAQAAGDIVAEDRGGSAEARVLPMAGSSDRLVDYYA